MNCPKCRADMIVGKKSWMCEDCGHRELYSGCASPKAGQLSGRETKTLDIGSGFKLDLIWCPAGSFLMGSPNDEKLRDDDEMQHRVTLTKGFWLGRTPVTQAQWEQVMGTNPAEFKGANRPVEKVSWEECVEFCRVCTEHLRESVHQSSEWHLSLPTEAQWEYAARAGTDGLFAGHLDDMAWYINNSKDGTHPVAGKQANAWGFHDMHGNVWEWCEDWYGNYPLEAVSDPVGLSSGAGRISRGGCWSSGAQLCRSAYRAGSDPGFRYNSVGFRVVCSAGL